MSLWAFSNVNHRGSFVVFSCLRGPVSFVFVCVFDVAPRKRLAFLVHVHVLLSFVVRVTKCLNQVVFPFISYLPDITSSAFLCLYLFLSKNCKAD